MYLIQLSVKALLAKLSAQFGVAIIVKEIWEVSEKNEW